MQGPLYRDRHKGGLSACATQCDVTRREQEHSQNLDRDSVGMGPANIFFANSSCRYVVLTGEVLPETTMNNTDDRPHPPRLTWPGRTEGFWIEPCFGDPPSSGTVASVVGFSAF